MAKITWDGDKALELRKQGLRYYQIAEQLGTNTNSVSSFFWRRFGKLEDKVISEKRGDIPISDNQKEVLFGTLMGDGNLRYNSTGVNVFGRINHCKKQFAYIKYLNENLKDLVSNVKPYIGKAKGNSYDSYYFTFKSNCSLNPFYHMFYTDGKKDVPIDLSLLTPRAMAFWFMDDGSSANPSIKIATCSFSYDGLTRLKNYLKKTYNIEVTITSENRLYFKSESARKFKKLVTPYMEESMMYKFKFVKD